MKRKLLALLLSMALAVGLLSTSALADQSGSNASEQYVLMNIPYAQFYEAEVGQNAKAVDAVSSATKMKPRTGGLADGSYHVDPEGSDITGVIYPVLVKDLRVLDKYTRITDESSVEITVTNRGQESTTTYSGMDALFEAPSYSYYVLSQAPALYKSLTVKEDGSFAFGPINTPPRRVTASEISVEYNTHHHNFVEISLGTIEGINGENDTLPISGAIATLKDGRELPLTHISNIWRMTCIGWASGEDVAGQTITNVRFITRNGIYDCPVSIQVKLDGGEITAAFDDAGTVTVTGLPKDIANPVATVQSQVGRGETPTVIAENAKVADGRITTAENAVGGTSYSVSIVSDNYADLSASAEFTLPVGESFLSRLIGTYQPLFEGATLNSEYDHYWKEYAAAVVGASSADETVAYVKGSINAPGYGKEAVPPNFYCGFADGVTRITFGGEDGKTVTYTREDGKTVTHTYAYVKETAAVGKYGEYDMAMPGYLYQAQELPQDEFQYLLMFPDTPDTTFHLEFRYADTEENVVNLLDGPYGYWVGSAIQTSALTEENEDTLQKVISLFVVENLAEMENEETAAQRAELIGTWDCDFSAFPDYQNARMYIVLSADGQGKTYADFTGSGTMTLTAEYTFFAYDADPADGKSAGNYISLNPSAETVTPGYYEIAEKDGKKALIFTSNEGIITYYYRSVESFADVSEDAYYAAPVAWAVERGITKGVDDTHFAPDAVCTRAQMVTFLWRAAGSPAPSVSENPFTDVANDSYYAQAVLWAAEKGITAGTSENTFSPDEIVDRAQCLTFLFRYCGEKTEAVNPFADVSENSFCYDAILWAVSKGITQGTSATAFSPDADCARGQIVTLLYRAAAQR